MKNIFYIFSLLLSVFFFPFVILAESDEGTGCKQYGYSVFTVNGMWTEEEGAIENMLGVEEILPKTYNDEPLEIGYLYNPSHIAGIGDVFDVLYQKLLDTETVKDFDLFKIHKQASEKIKTQKLLLVGHSQGNFYTNSLYDSIVDKEEGIPKESLMLYGVATPSERVAGGGKYITSKNDSIINIVRTKNILNVLPANIDIKKDNTNGHGFVKTYLENKKEKIRGDILKSLSSLKVKRKKSENNLCIGIPTPNIGHKIVGDVLSVIDPVAKQSKTIITEVVKVFSSSLAELYTNTLTTVFYNAPKEKEATIIIGYEDNIENDKDAEEIKEEKVNESQEKIVFIDEIQNSPITYTENKITTSEVLVDIETEDIKKEEKKKRRGGGGGSSNNENQNTEIEDNIENEEEEIPEELPEEEIPPEEEPKEEEIPEEEIPPEEEPQEEEIPEEEEEETLPPEKQYTYTYIQTPFGIDEEGRNWEVWTFNGSNVFDWTDTYVNGFLREQFKIQTFNNNTRCQSACLYRGVFKNGDPRNGFELSDFYISSLEYNPQNKNNNTIYNVALQWDEGGYEYEISHNGTVDYSGYTDIPNVNENMWIGWSVLKNGFKTFPTGVWLDIPPLSPLQRTGGKEMMLEPFPVYVSPVSNNNAFLSFPNIGPLTKNGINPTKGRVLATNFSFGIVYTSEGNDSPVEVFLNIRNASDGGDFESIKMEKSESGEASLSDGDFTNGELYLYDSPEGYEEGNYEYYFSSETLFDGDIQIPDNGFLNFETIPSTYTYIPWSFGMDEEGRNWQAWVFSASSIYDWFNTYEEGYLKQEFKMKLLKGLYGTGRIERGIFNHNPLLGFESSDVVLSLLEDNRQNSLEGAIYHIITKWDSGGYSYELRKDDEFFSSGYTAVENVNKNTWVGWDSSKNGFKDFSAGDWHGEVSYFSPPITGGKNMIIQPLPVYVP
ncbi:MAG: hypothetical protein WCX79_01885 [Candidatus Paceibacterota bacterium]